MKQKISDKRIEISIGQKEEGITGSNINSFYLVITSSLVNSINSCTVINVKFANFQSIAKISHLCAI